MVGRDSLHLSRALLALVIVLSCAHPARAGDAGPAQKEKADELHKQGIDLMEGGDPDKALEAFGGAAELFRQAGDIAGEAKARANLGFAYSAKKEWSKARDIYKQALGLLQTKANRALEANLLAKIALTFDGEKDFKTAVNYYRQAIPLLQAEGDHEGLEVLLVIAGKDLMVLRDNQGVLDLLLPALPSWKNLKNSKNGALALQMIALSCGELGRNQDALSYYEQSNNVWAAVGDRLQQAVVLESVARTESNLGNHEKALLRYNESLSIWRELKDTTKEARLLRQIGYFFFFLGDLQMALSSFNEALSLLQSLDSPAELANALEDVGRVCAHQKDYTRALGFLEKSLALWRRLGKAEGEAEILSFMGTVCGWAGYDQRALEYLDQALSLFQSTKNRASEVEVLSKLGLIYAKLLFMNSQFRNNPAIYGYLNLTTKRIQDLENPAFKAVMLGRIGVIYTHLGDPEKALDYHHQGFLLSRDAGDQDGAAIALFNSGDTYKTQNKPREALESYEKSIEIYDKMRASAYLEEIKTGLSESSANAYKRAATLRLQVGEPERSFDLSERARARTLLDQLANLRPKARQKASAEFQREEQALHSELFSLERMLQTEYLKVGPSFDRSLIAPIRSQLEQKQREYENLLIRIKLVDPEYASLRTVDTLPLRKVQALLSKDTTLISYFVTREETLVFIVTRDSFQALKLEATENELKREIEWFRQFTPLTDSVPEVLKRLHGRLIAPVRKYVKTPNVAIIPHGVLNYLPFAALTDGRRYFGEEYTVYYLPSASVLPFIREGSARKKNAPAGRQILAIAQGQARGLPALKYADMEAGAVASIFHAKALGTGNASKAEFLKQSGDYNVLHIAAHGELDPSNPQFSRIWLAPDEKDSGALMVHEVYDMDLPKADLVVLSACESQLGVRSEGDDIIGLNRAFIYAGTSTVLASLWTVDDWAASILMCSFYKNLRRGMSKAKALRLAQSKTRRRYRNPYYWAAFVLTGDPGPANRSYSTRRRSSSGH